MLIDSFLGCAENSRARPIGRLVYECSSPAGKLLAESAMSHPGDHSFREVLAISLR
ncbi:hypothetical protein ACWDTD_09275 [Gordonia sp. NPDC003425]